MYAVSLLCPEDNFLVSATASHPHLITPPVGAVAIFSAVDVPIFLSSLVVSEFFLY